MKRQLLSNRFLISYLPIFVVLAVCFFMILTGVINELKNRNIITANKQMVNYLAGYTEQVLVNIDMGISFRANNNNDLRAYIDNSGGNRQYIEYTVMKFFDNFMLEQPLISSMYLFHLGENTVLTSSGKFKVEDFYDAEFLLEGMKNITDNKWYNVRYFKIWKREAGVEVISMLLPVPRPSYTKGILIVNVSAEALLRNMRNILNDKNTYLDVLNKDDNSIFNRPILFKADHKKPEIANEIILSYNGWRFISGVYKAPVTQLLDGISSLWMITGLLMFLGGIVYIILISSKNDIPVKAILERMNQYYVKGMKLNRNKNDLKYIQAAITDMIETSTFFREQHEENLQFRKKIMFISLIEGTDSNANINWEREMENFGISWKFDPTFAAIFEIEKYGELLSRYKKSEVNILKYLMQNGINEVCNNNKVAFLGEWTSERRYSIIIICNKECNTNSLIRHMHQWIVDNSGLDITIGVGGKVSQIELIHASYNQACRCLELKTVLGNKKILFFNEIDTSSMKESYYKHMNDILEIVQKVKLSDKTWKDSYETFLNELSEDMQTRQNIKSLFNYMFYNITEIVSHMPEEIQKYWEENVSVSLHEMLEVFETLDDIGSVLPTAIESLEARIIEIKDQYDSIYKLNEIRAFIDSHYNDTQMSLEMLADRFNINQTFLSRLFKIRFSKNFSDYLTEKRVERSMELLAHSKMNIDEVARSVGYSHYVSFSRAFKKIVGITPGKYRQNLDRK